MYQSAENREIAECGDHRWSILKRRSIAVHCFQRFYSACVPPIELIEDKVALA